MAGLGNAQQIAATGITVQGFGIQTVGNNLANLGTTAFKGNRAEFSNLMYQFLTQPRAATQNDPGNNATQAGLGVEVGSTTFDLKQGPINSTGRSEDFAITGTGYFIVKNGDAQLFTRNGAFTLNSNGDLTTTDGLPVQGYGIDQNFNIVTNKVQNLTIPIGSISFGLPTANTNWGGQLNVNGAPATQAQISETKGTNATSLANPLGGLTVGGAGPLINDGSGGFSSPVTITYTPKRTSGTLAPASITLNPTDPLSKLTDFISNALSIDTAITQPAGNTAGLTLGAGGALRATGNLGTVSGFTINPADFSVTQVATGKAGSANLKFDSLVQAANGESAFAKSTIFDSQGNPVMLNTTTYLDGVTSTGSTWRVLYSSPDNNNGTTSTRSLGESLLTFDTSGRLVSDSNPSLTIDLADRAGVNPLTINNDYKNVFSMGYDSSSLSVTSQDGLERGELTDYSVMKDGTIVGSFSNGGSRPIGQFLLARFPNPEGLLAGPNGIFQQSLSSGNPEISLPGSAAGTVSNLALEGSNVDLAANLIQLLQYSVGFGANSRTFSTAQEMVSSFSQLIRQL